MPLTWNDRPSGLGELMMVDEHKISVHKSIIKIYGPMLKIFPLDSFQIQKNFLAYLHLKTFFFCFSICRRRPQASFSRFYFVNFCNAFRFFIFFNKLRYLRESLSIFYD